MILSGLKATLLSVAIVPLLFTFVHIFYVGREREDRYSESIFRIRCGSAGYLALSHSSLLDQYLD